MKRLAIPFPYLLFALLAVPVIWSNVRSKTPASVEVRNVDPICQMEVNPSWGFHHEHEAVTFHFCTRHCMEKFAADPQRYITQRCVVCDKPIDPTAARSVTYLDRTYLIDSETCRAAFKADPAAHFMHTMWGIPDWLYYASIAVVLLASFLLFEGGGVKPGRASRATARNRGALTISLPVLGQGEANDRIDLMRFGIVRRLLLSRPVRFAVQLSMVCMFLLIIAAGLFGYQNPALNIAPLLTWTIWWGGLVVLIMFAGKAWCWMCPWDAIASWVERFRLWKKTDEGIGLDLKWPRVLRNIWLATALFIGLTWIEIGFGVTMRPAATAWLAIAMVVMALVCAMLFERKSFCRYGCLVGRVSGLYAMFAGIEVRHADDRICRDCHTKECVKGSDTAYGCPTFEYPGKMAVNTYCIQCGECLQACPHQNLAVNLRPWGADLGVESKPRRDEAYLALLMLAISGFHGLTMTPVWSKLTDAIPGGHMISFTTGMAMIMLMPILIYAGLVWISYRLANVSNVTYHDYFVRYAYCVLPIALFYHLAHNLEHLLMEGPKVAVLASDPFGWGWDLFGTAGWHVPPLVSLDVLWILQVVLVTVGHVYSLWAARRISVRTFGTSAAATRSQWPLLLGMIAFSIFSLWLLKQPMEMRTSAM